MYDGRLMDRAFFQKSLRDLVRRDGFSRELRAFYDDNRRIWTTQERTWIDRIGNVGGWWKLWYSLDQEMRSYRGERADPDRLTVNDRSIGGRAARALMVPERLLRTVLRERDDD